MKKVKFANIDSDKLLDDLSVEEKMKLDFIKRMAISLMEQYAIANYKFEFGYGYKYAGLCLYNERIIVLNVSYARQVDLDDTKNVILHEIAHVLVGPGNGHRAIWQLKAKELGVHFYKNYRK